MINITYKINDISGVKTPFMFKKLLKKVVHEAAKLNDLPNEMSLSLIIVNDTEMKSLSNQYKHKNKTTDVLSFPDDYESIFKLTGERSMGDIYISAKQVEVNATNFNHSTKREWLYLFAHGVLHLMGHDHLVKKEENIMNAQANKIMSIIKVTR